MRDPGSGGNGSGTLAGYLVGMIAGSGNVRREDRDPICRR